MLDRLVPTQIFRAHWKGLADYRRPESQPDRVTRRVVVVVPLSVLAISVWQHFPIPAPASFLSALALFAGGSLGAFTHLSTLRMRLTERAETWGEADRLSRDSIDETAAHLLVAAYLSGVTVAVIVLGMNFGANDEGHIVGAWAGLAAGLLAYLFLVFVIAIPRLYTAYLVINNVRDAMSGAHRGK